MITQNEFNGIRALIETENQLIYKFSKYYEQAREPQLKEEFQKLVASLNNQKSGLINELEV